VKPEAVVPRWLVTSAAVAWRLLVVAGALAVAGLLFQRLHVIVLPVVGALFLSTILVPPAQFLRRHGWPPLAATWAVFIAGLVIVGGVVAALVPVIAGETGALGHALGSAVTRGENWLTHGPLHLSHSQVTGFSNHIRSEFTANQSKLVSGALSGATMAFQFLGGIVLSVVLTFFFVKDGGVIADWAVDLIGDNRAQELREVGSRAWAVLTGYVRGTAINAAINATVLGIGLFVLRVPLVLPIAVLTFVGGFLPLVGGLVSGAVALLVALATRGPVAALVMFALTVLIHHLEGYLVGPFVLGRAVRLHPVAVLILLAIGTILDGVIGAFMAVPLAAVGLAVNEHYRDRRRTAAIVEPGRAAFSVARHPEPSVASPGDGGEPGRGA
jgi:putative heme transporter